MIVMRIYKIIVSYFIIIICFITCPVYACTIQSNGWINGTMGWSYMVDGIYIDGWNNIDGKWYYFYKDTNFMAHDTIIDGYYIDSNGVWKKDMPYPIGQIIKNDMNYLNDRLKNVQWSFYTEENISFRELCNEHWNVPDIYGNVYWIRDGGSDLFGYFVSGDDVYCLSNQGGTDIYKVENGEIIQSIPYKDSGNYEWNSYSWRSV